MSNTQSGDFLSGLQDAVRQNPVSAALVGMGILWMFTGGNRITAAAALLGPAARAVGTGVGSGLQNSADAVGSVTEGIRSAGSRVADKTSDTLSDASEAVDCDGIKGVRCRKGHLREISAAIRQRTSRLRERPRHLASGQSEKYIRAAASAAGRDRARDWCRHGSRLAAHRDGSGVRG